MKFKNQNRRQKVLSRGFKFVQGDLTFWKFDNIFTDLYFFTLIFLNGWIHQCPPRLDDWFNGDWTGLNFAYDVIIMSLKKLKATIIESNKTEHNTLNG